MVPEMACALSMMMLPSFFSIAKVFMSAETDARVKTADVLCVGVSVVIIVTIT